MQTRQNGIRLATNVGCWLVLVGLAAPAFAVDVVDDEVQIDERAAQVAQTSNSLCWEMHRYHQQKPDYAPMYRSAKELWSRAGDLRNALRDGNLETEALAQQVAQMNDLFVQLEKNLSKWGDGDRSSLPLDGGPTTRTVVEPRVAVDIPFVGVRVGGPRYVVTEEGPPYLERRRLHPNSRGSKRSLERELAAVKVAVSYLAEDSGLAPGAGANSPAPAAAPVPNPPPDGPALSEPVKIAPPLGKDAGFGFDA
jgi:hypothetical protein